MAKNAVNYAYNNGVFLTASAGNQGWSNEHYPAAYDNVIGAAATNDEDKMMENAGLWDATSNYGSWVDVAAPGEDIFSTMPTYPVTLTNYFTQNYTGELCGTSCSAPHVAGLAALLLSYNSSLSPDDLKMIICGTADPYNSTYDIGTGRINAYNALNALLSDQICYNQQMYPNWNLISIPVQTGWWASDIADNLTGCLSFSRWDAVNQTYQTYIVGGPPTFDFPIEEGCGYFVDMNQTDELIKCGLGIDNISIPLEIGWNLLGWYHSYNTTASSLSGNISGCMSVSMWNASIQTYDTYIVGGPPTFNFNICRGMGLFVDVTEESVWYGEG